MDQPISWGKDIRYFPDLVPYQHGDAPPHPRIRRVGWIEEGHDFPTGTVPMEFLTKLTAIKLSQWPTLFHFGLVRGAIYCTLCDRDDRSGCSTELLVPDVGNPGCFFGSLSMIDHFVRDHGYCPPNVYVDSVLAVDLSKEFDAVVARDECVMSVDGMRWWYEKQAKQYANLVPEDQLTERQRAHRRLGEHLRYANWLKAHP